MTQPPPPPPGYGPPPARQTSSDAIVALVLAILSWAVCPVLLAIVALVFASKGKAAIAASQGWLDGSGIVTAAKVIAWLNIALAVIGGVLFLVLMLLGLVAGSQTDPTTGNAFFALRGLTLT